LITKLTLTGGPSISIDIEVDVWTVDSCSYPTSSGNFWRIVGEMSNLFQIGISSDKNSIWVTRANGSPYQAVYGNITEVAIAATCFKVAALVKIRPHDYLGQST
jgi:hypothetical protein